MNIVEMRNINKSFPGVKALSNISFSVKPGEVHVLLGENGAGKSTLMKVLSGVYHPDSGSIVLNGVELVGYSRKYLYGQNAEQKIGTCIHH